MSTATLALLIATTQACSTKITQQNVPFAGRASAESTTCVGYDPSVVTLTGKITSHPEYLEIDTGPFPGRIGAETYWYLDLNQPICISHKDGDSFETENEYELGRLQIVFFDGYPRGRWIGKQATITGTLVPGETVHHHTRVLIWSQSITKNGANNVHMFLQRLGFGSY